MNFYNTRNLRLFILVIMTFFMIQPLHTEELAKCSRGKTAHLIIFVHGSIFSTLSLLNLKNVLNDQLSEKSRYVQLLKKIRANSILWQDQILFKLGWHEISEDIISRFFQENLTEEEKKIATFLCVPAYSKLMQQASDTNNFYFTFGHLGLLSQQYRDNVADELYENLCSVRDRHTRDYEKILITFIAHSHGGNIVLNLAHADYRHQKNLKIDNAILYGTPLQVENVEYAYNSVFRRVINCYSDADIIQGNDMLSTALRKSFKKFNDPQLHFTKPVIQKPLVYDVRLLVNGDVKHINHANMWFLGKSKSAIDSLDPLPFVMITPFLLKCMNDLSETITDLDCNVIDANDRLCVTLSKYKSPAILAQSGDFQSKIMPLKHLIVKNWRPDDTSRSVVFNKKIRRVLIAAIMQKNQ